MYFSHEISPQYFFTFFYFCIHFLPNYSIQRCDLARNSNPFFSYLIKSLNPMGLCPLLNFYCLVIGWRYLLFGFKLDQVPVVEQGLNSVIGVLL